MGDTQRHQEVDRIRCVTLYRQQMWTDQEIADKIGRSRHFVIEWKRKAVNDCKTKQRSGAPHKLCAEAKALIRRSRGKRGGSSLKLKNRLRHIQDISISTIRRFQLSEGVRPYLRTKAPPLTQRNIIARGIFGRDRISWTEEQWNKVVWTDETEFTLFETMAHHKEYVWAADPASIPRIVRPTNQTKWMVSSGFSAKGVLKLIWVKKKAKVNQYTYQQNILSKHVANIKSRNRNLRSVVKTKLFDDLDDWIWQQDGAPAHRANTTQAWLRDNVPQFISREEWPGNSPDLNPVENLWHWLKMRVYHRGGFRTIGGLKAKVKQVWESIPLRVLQNLSNSMIERCRLVALHPESKLKY